MTFEEAQNTFQQIIRRITSTSTANDLLQAQRDLDTLTDALRGKDGFGSVRSGIDSLYDKLVGQITQQVLDDIRSRDEVFTKASSSLSAISQQANQNAATLSLEKTKIVLPALNKSIEELRGIMAAVKNGNQAEALDKGQALWVLVEQVKAKLAET